MRRPKQNHIVEIRPRSDNLPGQKRRRRVAQLWQSPVAFDPGGGFRPLEYKIEKRSALFPGYAFGFDELISGGLVRRLSKDKPALTFMDGNRKIAIQPLGVTAAWGQHRREKGHDKILYPDAWVGADLEYAIAGHVLDERIILKPGHPKIFRFKINRYLFPDLHGRIPLDEFYIQPPMLVKDDESPIPLKWEVEGNTILVRLPPDVDLAGWTIDPTVVIQPDAAAGIDNFLDQTATATNRGAAANLAWLYRQSTNLWQYPVLKFDFASVIPAGSTINSMIFEMVCYDRLNQTNGTQTMYIRAILVGNQDWTELGSTWLTYDGANPWAGSNGCNTAGTDFSNTALQDVDMTVTPYSELTTHIWTFDPAAAQALFNNNFGFKCHGVISGGTAVVKRRQYRSSDYGTAADRPKITVDYTPPAAVRLAFYTFNIWDPEAKILDRKGHNVEPNELRADRYMAVEGMDLPSAKVYDSFVEDPGKTRLVSVDAGEDGARIVANPNEFGAVILKRAGEGI